MPREVDRIELDDATIIIEDIIYHRGIIPLPQGYIDIDFSKFDFDEYTAEIWDYYFESDYPRFAFTYTEYLYPYSPPLGFHLEVEYFEYKFNEEDVKRLFGRISKKKINELKEKFEKLVDEVNAVIGKCEDVLYEYQEQLQQEVYDAMQLEEDEPEDEPEDEIDYDEE